MDVLIILLCLVNIGLSFINFIILRDLLDSDLAEHDVEDDFLDFKER